METKTFKQKRLELLKDAHDSIVKSLTERKWKRFIPLNDNSVLKEYFKGYYCLELFIIDGRLHCEFYLYTCHSLLLDISEDEYLIYLADYLNDK